MEINTNNLQRSLPSIGMKLISLQLINHMNYPCYNLQLINFTTAASKGTMTNHTTDNLELDRRK